MLRIPKTLRIIKRLRDHLNRPVVSSSDRKMAELKALEEIYATVAERMANPEPAYRAIARLREMQFGRGITTTVNSAVHLIGDN